jgi:hypothetical protein
MTRALHEADLEPSRAPITGWHEERGARLKPLQRDRLGRACPAIREALLFGLGPAVLWLETSF